MVSKIAVMALVAIVACPIMLGYAFNLDETTETRYVATGPDLNVTQLLATSTDYTYVTVDSYTLMDNFSAGIITKIYPNYQSFGTASSSIRLDVTYLGAGEVPSNQDLRNLSKYQAQFSYQSNYNIDYHYVQANLYKEDGGGNLIYDRTITKVSAVVLDKQFDDNGNVTRNRLYYSLVQSNGGVINYQMDSVAYIEFSKVNDYNGYGVVYKQSRTSPMGYYVNYSQGFTVNHYGSFDKEIRQTTMNAGMDMKSIVMTLDLDSITDSNYTFGILGGRPYHYNDGMYWVELEKTTTDGVVKWWARTMHCSTYPSYEIVDLQQIYYDPNGSNTYQLVLDAYNAQFRYVGAWPATPGLANSYKIYDLTLRPGSFEDNPLFLTNILLDKVSPVMRMDSAVAKAFVVNAIEDNVYTPSAFKSQPQTTLSNLTITGSSITFAGHTYQAKDDYILMSGHKIPINGLTFSSVLTDAGYENRIGGDLISTTAAPSTITFNGRWGVDVKTISLEPETYTETEWVAGSFAWDGIDSNFLMAGLLTCLGAFIALGIYGRRSGAKVLPLMLVCGGAGILFLLMI